MMRLYPSLIYLGRLATEPVTRHDVTIPAGAVVRLTVASAHRDERTFAEPDRFWPNRPDLHGGRELRSAPTAEGRASHLGFGAGPHFCLGYELARVETLAVTRRLMERCGGRPRLVDAPAPRTVPPARAVERLVIQL